MHDALGSVWNVLGLTENRRAIWRDRLLHVQEQPRFVLWRPLFTIQWIDWLDQTGYLEAAGICPPGVETLRGKASMAFPLTMV